MSSSVVKNGCLLLWSVVMTTSCSANDVTRQVRPCMLIEYSLYRQQLVWCISHAVSDIMICSGQIEGGTRRNSVPLPFFEGERRSPSSDGRDGWTVRTQRTTASTPDSIQAGFYSGNFRQLGKSPPQEFSARSVAGSRIQWLQWASDHSRCSQSSVYNSSSSAPLRHGGAGLRCSRRGSQRPTLSLTICINYCWSLLKGPMFCRQRSSRKLCVYGTCKSRDGSNFRRE